MRQSAISYFADMIMSPLVALALSAFALTHFTSAAIVEWVLLVSFGCAFWTLVEYVMHRFIYHRIPAFERYHQIHHANPRAYVGAPPLLGTTVTFLVSFMPLVTVAPIVASGFSAGVLLGYTLYMFIHYAIHFWDLTPGSFLYRARLHHAVHHYRDGNGNFGVTTSFWDRVFGTRISSARAFA